MLEWESDFWKLVDSELVGADVRNIKKIRDFIASVVEGYEEEIHELKLEIRVDEEIECR